MGFIRKDGPYEFTDMYLVRESEKAYLIKDWQETEFWIPKSQVMQIDFGDELEENGKTITEICNLVIPEWLAEEKGLI